MKVIRAVKRYIESAEIECNILNDLNSKDLNDEKGIVQLKEHFRHGSNYCLVFENLGLSLYELLKKFKYTGFSMRQVQSFFK